LGARLTRGSSLSDANVISYINANFVAIELNLSRTGFPPELAGLKPWQRAYNKDWRYRQAFATSVVLSPDGRFPLGTSGSGHRNEFASAANYHPDKFLSFLSASKSRADRLTTIMSDNSLSGMSRARALQPLRSEIIQQLRDANSRGGFRRKPPAAAYGIDS
jgi:hypothetical protein